MATQSNNLHVPDELLGELQRAAQSEGKTVDEIAEAALRKGLEERGWLDLLNYGRERGSESGVREDEVAAVVKEWRRERRKQ